MTRFRAMVALLLPALALGALAGSWARNGDEEVLTILHTNDMHGHVLGSEGLEATGPGGLARIVTMVRQIKAGMPNVLFLDAGDIIHSTPTEFYNQGRTMIAAMNAAGYDAATIGNHEFDWGQDTTASVVRQAKFPMLTANVRDVRTGKPYAGTKEYVILRRGAVRVAVFGLTTMETVKIEWPANMTKVRFVDPVETARRLVPELRGKADLVVFLSHLGYREDQAMAKAVPGIDVIIGGHSHTTLDQHTWVGDTVIAQTGSYAKNLGRMDLLLRRSGNGWRVASVNGQGGKWWADEARPPLGKTYPKAVLIPAEESVAQAPDVAGPYRVAWEKVHALLDTPIATAPATIEGRGGTTTPRPLQPTLADLLRRVLNVDVGIIAGDAGPEIPAGTVTARTVYELIGGYTRQNVVVVRPTGAALKKAVEDAYANIEATGPKARPYPVYFAGLNGRIVPVSGGARWEDAAVNGRPLDPNATYTVASVSYLIMDSPSLSASPIVSDQVGWVKPLLIDAMRARRTITPYAFGLALPEPVAVQ